MPCLATVHVGVCINNLKHGIHMYQHIFQTSHYPVHHKHQLSSHVALTCNLKLLVHHTLPWPACSHLLGPLAVPNHHGSAVLFHRSMQRAHPVLLTWDTSMSFNPQSQTPNTTVPNFVPMLLHYNHAVPRVIYGLNTDGVDS